MIINDIFVGGESDSWNDEIDAQTCVNWYPVVARDKTVKALRRCPGVKEWDDCTTAGGFTVTYVNNVRVFPTTLSHTAAFWTAYCTDANTHIFKTNIISSGGPSTITELATISSGNAYHERMLLNDASQIMMIRDSIASTYDVYNINTDTLSNIAAGINIHSLAYLDGFFFVAKRYTNQVYATDYLDATTLDTTNYGSAIGSAGDVVGLASDKRFLWVFCEFSTEVWYNAGESGFPLLRNPSVFHEVGLRDRRAITDVEGAIFFEGVGKSGLIGIYKTEGFNIKKISNESIDLLLKDVPSTTNYNTALDSFGYLGDIFILVHFRPGSGADDQTWMYSDKTGLWNQIKGNTVTYYPVGLGITSTSWGRRLLCMSTDFPPDAGSADPTIFEIDFNYYLDDVNSSAVMACERISKHIFGQDNKALIHHRLELEFSKDASLAVALSYSDDDGDNWTSVSTLTVSDGRYVWRGLGRSRDRIYKITTSTNVEATLISSWLDAEQLDV